MSSNPTITTTSSSWQQRARAAYDETQAKIPAEWRIDQRLVAPAWVDVAEQDPDEVDKRVDGVLASSGVLSEDELRIVHSNATAIVDKLQRGEWSAVAVVTAFCKSAAIAQQLYRCCTELFFDRALERARELDDHFSKTGKPVGPLHGLPISLKDQHELKGMRNTIGFVSWLDKVADADGPIGAALQADGAVLYVKSNVPTSLFSSDTVNHIWGRCLNPLDRRRGAGGSSGGEAALLAAFASPLGLGSDIAGSCRMPAAMCGVYGFKPSCGRLPILGGAGVGAGAEFVLPVWGPLARSIPDLELLLRSVISSEPWKIDPTCVPMPWKPVTYDRPLRIGVLRDNGMVRPHPPIRRVLDETVAKLKAAGHEVIDWDVAPLHVKAHKLAFAFFHQDGGAMLRATLQDEPVLPNIYTGKLGSELSTDEVLKSYWEAFGLRIEYRQRWNALNLDAVICPNASHAAVPPDDYNDWTHTLPWNLLQYCALAMPVGKVEERDMEVSEEYKCEEPRKVEGFKEGLKKVRGEEENRAMWLDNDLRRDSLGLPLSLQVVAPHWMDEQCLAMGAIIEKVIKS
ncbi:fatty-acid amide hydrolase [Rhodotorula toruloides]|uniref:Fatty-acid amide hydrolase n=1 Tax=Rhodotorula toruloides TaxID=5286 RepID=A0A511KQU0_RHOTO|nr:fatty-acid amide hydrolase [Rhodotorula toruloides]